MVHLTADEIARYHEDGQLTPSSRLPRTFVARLQDSLTRLIAARPELRPDFIPLPHTPWDDGEAVSIAREFFEYVTNQNLLSIVEQIIGPDIVLWASAVLCKPPATGLEVPWHQDGQYWPIHPRATVTLWIALDEVSVDNGCMRVIPETHRSGDFSHLVSNREDLVLNNVVNDPRVEVVYDDARHFLATTREKFDIITSDPIHPWVKGAAVLYTSEYFELCREHLNPGGLVTQWVPFYESSRAVVQSEIATFFAAFPHGTIWGNDDEGYGYDTVVLGQESPLHIDVDALQLRLDRADHATVKKSLGDIGLSTANDLLATYAGRATELKKWLAPAELNRDRSLRLQYLAGLQLESTRGAEAYHELIAERSFPADIFRGSPDALAALERMFPTTKP